MMFVKATKKQQKARVALIGPAGSGKTYTALTLAKHLGQRIAVIDTERGSASKYSGDVADFDVCEPARFAPKAYVDALHGAAAAGYDVVVIDSLSHAWEGEGGVLDQVDQRGKGFESWKDMTPQMRGLIDAILGYPGHVIATLRSKTEWVVEERENRNGKIVKTPRKIGLAPKFKDGLEYEFDVVALMDDAVLTVTKSRCSALADLAVKRPGKPFADTLRAWLDDGAERPAAATAASAPPPREESHAVEPQRARRPEDCADADELLAWCRARASGLARLTNGRRAEAFASIEAAARRTGLDEMEALRTAGLLVDDEPAAD